MTTIRGTTTERPEIAPVRPGEELDRDALAAWLRAELSGLGVQVEGELELAQFPNGHANLTYLASFGELRLVVRRPPMGRIAPGAHDMKREHKVLSRLWRLFDRAPRAYLLCTDHAVLGADFLVSEYRPGVVVWDRWPAVLGSGDLGRRVGFATVDALADLHAVDIAAAGLDDLGRPEGYLVRQVDGWMRRWELVTTPELDSRMTALGTELRATLPESAAPVVLHNDFKIDNCQFAPGRPDRVTSVFDWDMATLGDPLADLGMLLNYWPDPSDVDGERPLHVPGLEIMGLPTRAEVAARYAERTGADLSRIAWYEAFCSWKIAVVCQQLSIRWLRGESTDPRMAAQAANPPRLLRRAEQILRAAS